MSAPPSECHCDCKAVRRKQAHRGPSPQGSPCIGSDCEDQRERLTLRPIAELHERIAELEDLEDFDLDRPLNESVMDELIAQLIRCYSIKLNGITHQEAMELTQLFYAPVDDTFVPAHVMERLEIRD